MTTHRLADAAAPGPAPAATLPAARGVAFASAQWTGDELAKLLARLETPGAAALSSVSDQALLAAWSATVAAFRDPRSPEREALAPALAALCGLSPAGLAAGLEAVLGGVSQNAAHQVLRQARGRRQPAPALVVLAGNLPGLAVQPLLPALALRRPLLLKSARDEPLFAPAFVAALARRMPALGEGVAAVTWPGGDAELERAVLTAVPTVLAYGGAEAMADLRHRAAGRVIDYGPKLSLALVGADADPAQTAAGLARDVALFDQRGCLSIQAVLVEGERQASVVAAHLAAALLALADELPPGPLAADAAAAVQQLRGEASMRGLWVAPMPLAAGTVVVEPGGALLLSPGLRTVRVHSLGALAAALPLLAPWQGSLQGAALCGEAAWALAPQLERLGFTRLAPPGQLQAADAAWHNGGRDPLEVLAAR